MNRLGAWAVQVVVAAAACRAAAGRLPAEAPGAVLVALSSSLCLLLRWFEELQTISLLEIALKRNSVDRGPWRACGGDGELRIVWRRDSDAAAA